MKTSEIGTLDLENIRIDGGTQSRLELNESVVADYADAIIVGNTLPPVVVFFDGTDHWLADGFHRYFGHKKLELVEITADIREGTRRDAVLYSVGANGKHGLRRSNADKRNAVETVLKDPEWAAWSDRKIAEVCGVGAPLVGDVRRSICNQITDAAATRTVERNGKTYTQDTSNIGKAQLSKLTPEQVERSAVRIEAEMNREKRAQIAELQSELTDAPEDDGPSADELATQAAAEEADRALVATLLESDAPLAALAAENKQLKAEIAQLKQARDGYMNRCNEAIALVKSRDRQIAKLEQLVKAAA